MAFAAAPARAQTPGLVPIRVGAINIESAAEGYYADEMGFFKRAGLDARVSAMSSAGAIVAAAMGGALDVVPTNCVTMAQAYAKGLPLYLIAPGAVYSSSDPTTELAVAPDSTYRVPRDLNGKKIAVLTLGGFLQVAIANWLDANGGDSKTVSFIELPSPEIVPALSSKRIDAAGLPEPFLTKAKSANEVRFIAAPYSSVGKRLMLSVWIATKPWVDANPATARKFVTAMRSTAEWADKNQKASATILTKYTRVPLEVIENMRRDPFATRMDTAAIQPIVDVCAKYGLIPRRFSASELLAPNLL